MDGKAEKGHGKVVCVASFEEGVVADACEKIVLVPNDLGTSKVVGMPDFGDRGGAPGGINGVSVLAASDLWCGDGMLPVVDEGPWGSA